MRFRLVEGIDVYDAVADLDTYDDKIAYLKKVTPTNNCGASEEAFNIVKQAFEDVSAMGAQLIEIDANDKKLVSDLKKVAKENGIEPKFKTTQKKHKLLRGYSPISGGGAKYDEYVNKRKFVFFSPVWR